MNADKHGFSGEHASRKGGLHVLRWFLSVCICVHPWFQPATETIRGFAGRAGETPLSIQTCDGLREFERAVGDRLDFLAAARVKLARLLVEIDHFTEAIRHLSG